MGEIIIGVLLILLSAVIYFSSNDFPQINETHLDPGSYPKLIALLITILSAALIIKQSVLLVKSNQPIFKSSFKEFVKKQWYEYRLVILIMFILGLYVILMNVIGFIVTSILFIIAAGLTIGPRQKKDIVIISAISLIITIGMYFFFENVLYVRFPSGMFI